VVEFRKLRKIKNLNSVGVEFDGLTCRPGAGLILGHGAGCTSARVKNGSAWGRVDDFPIILIHNTNILILAPVFGPSRVHLEDTPCRLI